MDAGQMHTVTSFHASVARAGQVNAVMADYLALERARIFRRLLFKRFGLLAVIAAILGAGFHWLPPFASGFSVSVFLALPIWAWIVERQRDRRLARRLEELPDAATQIVLPSPGSKKVVKSS